MAPTSPGASRRPNLRSGTRPNLRSGTPDLIALGKELKAAQHVLRTAIDSELAQRGSTLGQWAVLREIAGHPGALGTEIAELAWHSPQATQQIVAKLTAQGLIDRQPGVGRAIHHYLTDLGKTELRHMNRVVRTVHKELFGVLDQEELTHLHRLLEQLTAGHIAQRAV